MILNILCILILLIDNVFDVYATSEAFRLGIAESNPIMDWWIDKFGFGGLLFLKVMLVSILMLAVEHIKGVYTGLLSFAVIVYASLSVFHISFI